MPLELTPRASAPTCPPCRDTVAVGPRQACPACGAVYHDDCAQFFGRCVVMACPGRFLSVAALRAMPRVASVAPRVARWRETLAGLEGPWLVFITPAPEPVREDPAAARTLGDLLGQTAYDGRLRLSAPYAELVARAEGRGDADEAVAALRRVGVPAHVVGAPELMGRFRRFEVHTAELGEEEVVVWDAHGRRRAFGQGAARLALRGVQVRAPHARPRQTLVEGTGRLRVQGLPGGGRHSDSRHTAFVFDPDDPEPAVVLERELSQVRGALSHATSRGAFEALLRRLGEGPHTETRSLGGLRLGHLLHSEEPEGRFRSNRAVLRLLARLEYFAWRDRRRAGARDKEER